MKFFFDNNLPPRLVKALASLDTDSELIHLRSKFTADVADEVWIPALKEEGGWVVVSGDITITRNKGQLQIWRESGMTGFFLARGWMSLDLMEQASKFIRIWPKIVSAAGKYPTGKIFSVQVNGRIKVIKG